MYNNTIIFEPTPVRRGDGSKTARTMVPTMMPDWDGDFDHCNGEGKSKSDGATTKSDMAMMEGREHIMANKEDNNVEWAVGDGGGGGDHKTDFWANVQQHNHHLSQHPSAGETGEQGQGHWFLQLRLTTTAILIITTGAASQTLMG
jgi:hypothetical protein